MSETADSIQHSAGGLVYHFDGNRLMVLMIKDSYGHWTFPKGHLEANESLEETAKREIEEETGIPEHSLITKAELGEISYWFNSSFTRDQPDAIATDQPIRIHKYVTYFLFELKEEAALTAQLGEVEAAAWVPVRELEDRNDYDDNHEIIAKAKRYWQGLVH